MSDKETMKWFVLNDSRVEGPYSTESLVRRIDAGEVPEKGLIWGPLQTGWKSLSWWKQSLPHLKAVQLEISTADQWFYARNGRRVGPMNREELVTQLNSSFEDKESLAKMLVWTKGFKKWTPINELHDLMNDLGIDQRKHPRAKAHGKVIVTFQDQTFISSIRTISEGGLGIEPLPMVCAGEEVQISIESKDFESTISTKAEVRYVNSQNMGLQFKTLNSENKASIVTYIKSRIASQTQKSAA